MPNPRFDDESFDDNDWNIDDILKGDPATELPRDIVDIPVADKHTFDGKACPKCANGTVHGIAGGTGDSTADEHIDEALQAFVETLPPWMRDSVKFVHVGAPGGNEGAFHPHPGVSLKDLTTESWDFFLDSVVSRNGESPMLRALWTVLAETTGNEERLTHLWEFYMMEHKMMVFSSMTEATFLFFAALEENPVKVQGSLSDEDLVVIRGCHDDLLARQRLLYEEYCELGEALGLPTREEFANPRTMNLYDESPLLSWTAVRLLGWRLENIVTLKEMRDEFHNRGPADDGDDRDVAE